MQPGRTADQGNAAAYSPVASLIPRGWLPLVEQRDDRWRVGGAVVGVDVLARHVASASAHVGGDDRQRRADLAPRSRPDWDAAYTYQRWQPAFYVAAQDRTSLFDAVTSTGALVSRWRSASRRRRRRVASVSPRALGADALAAYHVERADARTRRPRSDALHARGASDRVDVHLRAALRLFDQPGGRRDAGGHRRDSAVRTGGGRRVRTPSPPTRVRTCRLGGRMRCWPFAGAGRVRPGDDDVQRRYPSRRIGRQPVAGAFGSDAISLLRGFQDDVFVGRSGRARERRGARAALSVQRGWGTWPLFLRSLHAVAFPDIGHAWTGRVTWADRKIGYGVELSADVVAGFGLPLTWTAGMGWGRDGAGDGRRRARVYFRVGRVLDYGAGLQRSRAACLASAA